MKVVKNIREEFLSLKKVDLKSEDNNYEILNASFIADEDSIFGKLNADYIKTELDWYMSQSRYIKDMKGKIPKIWKDIADKNGMINSNYGWCIFSEENYLQFQNAIIELIDNKFSRRGSMIYIRPTMHNDATRNGMDDFMCTYAAQLLIRNNKLHYFVYMRSNDAIFGYKNDRFWHDSVLNTCLDQLHKVYPDLEKGNIYWNCASLHIYPRHFDLIK